MNIIMFITSLLLSISLFGISKKQKIRHNRCNYTFQNMKVNNAEMSEANRLNLYREINELFNKYSLLNHQNIKVSSIGTINQNPIYNFRIGDPKSKNKILITAGVHAGTEAFAVAEAIQLIKQYILKLDQNEDFYLNIFPLINPLGLILGERTSPQGPSNSNNNSNNRDLNRSMIEANNISIYQLISQNLKNENYNIALDLHGAPQIKKFFVLSTKKHDPIAQKAIQIIPKDLRLSKPINNSYYISKAGVAFSHTQGTFKQYFAENHAKYSYTVEYPEAINNNIKTEYYHKLIMELIKESF